MRNIPFIFLKPYLKGLHRPIYLLTFSLSLSLLLSGCVEVSSTTQVANTSLIEQDKHTKIDKNARLNVRFELAKNYIAAQQYAPALKSLDEILALDEQNTQALHLKAIVLMQQNQSSALDFFEKALKTDAQNPHILNNYGWFLCKQGNYSKGLSFLKEAEAYADSILYPRLLSHQGACHYLSNKQEAQHANTNLAIELLKQSQSLQANYMPTQLWLAHIYAKQSNTYLAESIMQNMTLNNINEPYMLWLGYQIWQLLGNPITAKLWGEKLVNNFPVSFEAKLYQRQSIQTSK